MATINDLTQFIANRHSENISNHDILYSLLYFSSLRYGLTVDTPLQSLLQPGNQQQAQSRVYKPIQFSYLPPPSTEITKSIDSTTVASCPVSTEQSLIIRLVVSSDSSATIQGLGLTEDVLLLKIPATDIDFIQSTDHVSASSKDSNDKKLEPQNDVSTDLSSIKKMRSSVNSVKALKIANILKIIYRFQSAFLSKLVHNLYGPLHLAGLSNTVMIHICGYLEAKDLGALQRVCKAFQSMPNIDIVWEMIYYRMQGVPKIITAKTYKAACESYIIDMKRRLDAILDEEKEKWRLRSIAATNLVHPNFQYHPPQPRIYPTHPDIILPGIGDEFLPPPFSVDVDPRVYPTPSFPGSQPIFPTMPASVMPPEYMDPLTGLPTVPRPDRHMPYQGQSQTQPRLRSLLEEDPLAIPDRRGRGSHGLGPDLGGFGSGPDMFGPRRGGGFGGGFGGGGFCGGGGGFGGF